MDLVQMHVWFRQYAQQMGMQNHRAILPETIDLLINTSISDAVNELIKAHVAATNDRIVTDNSKLDQINTLRSLHDVKELTFNLGPVGESQGANASVGDFDIDPNTHIDDDSSSDTPSELLGGPIREDTTSMSGKWYMEYFTRTREQEAEGNYTHSVPALYVVDLSINYSINGKITAYYPVRLIDDAYLADTMQDYTLAPRVRTPIAVIYNNTLDLYLGDNFRKGNGLLRDSLVTPNKLRVSYLKYPNQVKFVSDLGQGNVNCDLPENMHIDILKHAVDLYNISIQGSLHAAQQQQQRQNREMARNTARPDNEGYQQ